MAVCICKRNGRRNPYCDAHCGFRNRRVRIMTPEQIEKRNERAKQLAKSKDHQ